MQLVISHIGDNKHNMDAKPKQASSKMHDDGRFLVSDFKGAL